MANAGSTIANLNTAWLQGRNSLHPSGHPVLIVDDSDTDIFFLLRAIAASKVTNPIYAVRSGAEALAYLQGVPPFADRELHPLPGVVFLDLRMPPPTGLDILQWKRMHSPCGRTLFVAMSNFDSIRAINEAYAAGASTFLSKPLNAEDVRNVIEAFETYWVFATGREELTSLPSLPPKAG